MDIGELRQEYSSGKLHRADLAADPIDQFARWFAEAKACEFLVEPNAMTLATCGTDGHVSARTVLLKDWDRDGFRFFTNYGSAKAQAIEGNPNVSLLFHWAPLERQVQICGTAAKTSREESEEYFKARPVASQLGAWASHQSEVVASREELEAKYAEFEAKFDCGQVPVPPFWGGYVVRPTSIEFWQGRRSRLHDRFRYRAVESGWFLERLAP